MKDRLEKLSQLAAQSASSAERGLLNAQHIAQDLTQKNKVFALLLISICFFLNGCKLPSEYTETIPAHLELEWEQTFDQNQSNNLKKLGTVPPEIAQQLAQLGQYRSSATINYTNLQAKVVYKLVFFNETTIDDKHKIISLLQPIFKEKSFTLIFQGKEEKLVSKQGFGFFTNSQTTTMTTKMQIIGTATVLGQLADSK